MPAERFFLLLDGHIRVMRTTPHGEQIIALHIAPGQLFGIAKALGHTKYPATAKTADECLTLSWPNLAWKDFIRKYDGFAEESYNVVGERVAEMNNRIVELATQHVEQRVACSILRLIDKTGKQVNAGIEIDFPITRQNLAEMTGTTLHTVSRLLSSWEKEGTVLGGRQKVIVRDVDRLISISEA